MTRHYRHVSREDKIEKALAHLNELLDDMNMRIRVGGTWTMPVLFGFFEAKRTGSRFELKTAKWIFLFHLTDEYKRFSAKRFQSPNWRESDFYQPVERKHIALLEYCARGKAKA